MKENDFRWRDQSGIFHDPRLMETRHLFYVLRMIWNHTMPEDMKVTPYVKHEFTDFYSVPYLANAVKVIGKELLTRTDITPQWKKQLEFMESHFGKRKVDPLLLPANPNRQRFEMPLGELTL